jgi:hypothetical protein
VRPGQDFSYLRSIGNYIVAKKPEKVIQIGDWADMESLCSYDVGTKSFEGRRYVEDIKASQVAMATLLAPLVEFNAKARAYKEKLYKPELHLTLGNHENRINKAVEKDAKLDGVLSITDLKYEQFGFKVYPFLDVVILDGIAYSHYFTSGIMGRPVPNAAQLLIKKHMSCVMGHVQDRGIAYGKRADGKHMTGIFSGLSTPYEEGYLNPQTNNAWRGIWVLHDVDDGAFDEMPVSLRYLKNKYG